MAKIMSDPAAEASTGADVARPDEPAFEETGVKRVLAGWDARAVAAIALCFSTYQLVIAAYAPLSSLPTRSIHVGFLLALAFLIHPVGRWVDRHRIAWYDALIAAGAFALSLYHLVFEADLIQRAGDPSLADLVVGAVFIVLLFEAARRVLGIALPIICGVFLAYGLLGQYLPGYEASPRGALLGLLYGFFGGFAAGWIFAITRNAAALFSLAVIRRRIQSGLLRRVFDYV